MTNNILRWIVIGAIALFAVGMLGGLFSPFGWMRPGYGGYGYGCADGWGYGMMGGWSGWGMMPFGFLGMLFVWLIPLGVFALIVGGVFWIVRSLTQKKV